MSAADGEESKSAIRQNARSRGRFVAHRHAPLILRFTLRLGGALENIISMPLVYWRRSTGKYRSFSLTHAFQIC
jgi:hypothetical protein